MGKEAASKVKGFQKAFHILKNMKYCWPQQLGPCILTSARKWLRGRWSRGGPWQDGLGFFFLRGAGRLNVMHMIMLLLVKGSGWEFLTYLYTKIVCFPLQENKKKGEFFLKWKVCISTGKSPLGEKTFISLHGAEVYSQTCVSKIRGVGLCELRLQIRFRKWLGFCNHCKVPTIETTQFCHPSTPSCLPFLVQWLPDSHTCGL